VRNVSRVVLIAGAVAVLALVIGSLVGAVIVPVGDCVARVGGLAGAPRASGRPDRRSGTAKRMGEAAGLCARTRRPSAGTVGMTVP
jgi:hypothetical protein